MDSDGNSVGNAEVIVYQPKADAPHGLAVVGKGTTALDGAFFLDVTPVSEITSYVTAKKEGLAYGWNHWSPSVDRETFVRLGRPSVLAGKVVDETGAAIAGAQVRARAAIEYPDDRRSTGVRRVSLREFREPVIDWLITSTDSDGRFTLKDIPEDARAYLIVKAAGRASVRTKREKRDAVRQPGDQYIYSAGQTDIVVELPPEAVITGRVVERDTGKGVGGIELWITPGVGGPYPVSAEDGAFRVGNLAPGEYTLRMNPGRIKGRVAEPVTVKVAAGEAVGDVKMSLFPGALLEVHVTDARSGEPIEGARVSFRATGERGRYNRGEGTTETQGVAEVRLLPGKYSLESVWDPDNTYQSWRSGEIIEVADGEVRRMEVALRPRFETFAGVVRDAEGKPVEGAAFHPVGGNFERDAKTPRTDESGRFSFRFEPWPSEGVTLFVRQRERALAARFDVTDAVKQPFEITLRPAPGITGKVTDPDGGPIAGASVRVTTRRSHAGGGFQDVPVMSNGAKTGDDGRYTVAAIPPGFSQKYGVEVRAGGYARKQMGVYIDDTNPVVNEIAPITLNPANASISGIVVDSSGDPVAGARVSATGFGSRMEDNSIQWQRSVHTRIIPAFMHDPRSRHPLRTPESLC
ncbi:MAG: carboxypeptidase-like regulatory domain-containing protein [Planctomycetota bacterium]